MKEFYIGQVVKFGGYLGVVNDAIVEPTVKKYPNGLYGQVVTGLELQVRLPIDICEPATDKECEVYFRGAK